MLSKSHGDHRWRLTCWTKRVSIVELVFCNEFTVFLVIIRNQIPREPGQCFRVSLHKYVTVTLLYSLGPPFSAKTQLWSIETWTQQEFWKCGSKMLAADPLNPVNCEMGPPWMRLVCPSSPTAVRLDWDLGIWQPDQHLELVVVFIKPFPNHICSVAAEATAIRDYCFHEGV